MSNSVRFDVGELNPCAKDSIDNTGANEGEISRGDNEVTGAKMGEDVGSMFGEKLQIGAELGTELELNGGVADTSSANVCERAVAIDGVMEGFLEIGVGARNTWHHLIRRRDDEMNDVSEHDFREKTPNDVNIK